jgi:hypothetical protein
LSARNPRDAVEAVRGALQRVVSAVSDGVLRSAGRPINGGEITIYVAGTGAATLSVKGGGRLLLSVEHEGTIVRSETGRRAFRVQTTGYNYRVLTGAGEEILGYHWHPIGESDVKHLHLHIWSDVKGLDLRDAHFPTPRVSLKRMLLQAVEELGVETEQPDWERILGKVEHGRIG